MKRSFNKNQKMAVEHGDGPCLVIAGPGSGKTYVLTNRILSLITNKNVNADSILIITFTRAAANEMETRFFDLAKSNKVSFKGYPTFGTFHSIFYDILRNVFGYTNKSLLSDKEEKDILLGILKDIKGLGDKPEAINYVLKDIKNYKLLSERGIKAEPKFISLELFDEIYKVYQRKLYEIKKLDFSDMISKCYELLKSNPNVLTYYQKKYKYILVDEFQDINKLQYDIVKLICKSKNIFVVGDDDQSIYKFRGSYPRVINDFLRDFKRAKVILLNENYRCARQIVKFSKLVIDHNLDRFSKNLVSNRPELGKLEIKAFVDSADENKYLIESIKKYLRDGYKFSDIAILYRTNLLSNSIKMDLSKNNMPYIVKGEEKINTIDDYNSVSNSNAINLMTFHLSKGLEFKTVFIIDANDGLIPHKKSIRENDLEIERRLFYVAMTRAKDSLHILFTTRRFGKDFKPSRFILEAIGG
ncbi:MAG: ATP-dependent helicase [Lachnospiraceae bacterium]|nr:ATP-dependent helicase [Lachnospiraceae bacterium]